LTDIRTQSGKIVRLGSLLGKGGEGDVFHLVDQKELAVKLYTDGKQAERKDKILAMAAQRLHEKTSFAAFPIEPVIRNSSEFIGFTMRKVGGVKPIHELYAPGSRKIEFPRADYKFLVRTATNVARAIASVHTAGCVIGDINHSGILVAEQATVTLIDADSFQMRLGTRIYRCIVGAGEYTPPELQGAAFKNVDREPIHDTFGLAVIVFQLLFMGRHPFAGRYAGSGDMPIEKAIREGRFAYSVRRKNETLMDPPPFAPTLMDVSLELASAFEQAFPGRPSEYRGRPSAANWVDILSRFESELISCKLNPAHSFAKSASACPWCRLESGMSVALFPGAGISTGGPQVTNFDLTAAISAIDRILGPGHAPDPEPLLSPRVRVSKSEMAKQIASRRMGYRVGGITLAAISLFVMSSGFGFALIGLIISGFMVFGGGNGYDKLLVARSQAERNWSAAKAEWQQEAGSGRFDQKRQELRELVAEHNRLPILERERLADLDRRRRELQLQRFLEGYLIARANISGIGPGRKATLASFGIENAFDVSSRTVLSVPGFGDTMTKKLVDWRKSIEQRFVFNPNTGVDPALVRRIKLDISNRRVEIERALQRGPMELQQIGTHAKTFRNVPSQRLIEAYRAFKQAEVDAS
jgi:DNA-binding helix-hairpin-helix protein with protein kinase domain